MGKRISKLDNKVDSYIAGEDYLVLDNEKENMSKKIFVSSLLKNCEKTVLKKDEINDLNKTNSSYYPTISAVVKYMESLDNSFIINGVLHEDLSIIIDKTISEIDIAFNEGKHLILISTTDYNDDIAIFKTVVKSNNKYIFSTSIENYSMQVVVGEEAIVVPYELMLNKDIDFEPIKDSEHLITSGGVYTAILDETNKRESLYSNSLKGTISGENIEIKDISPLTHELKVTVNVSDDVDVTSVKVYQDSINLLSEIGSDHIQNITIKDAIFLKKGKYRLVANFNIPNITENNISYYGQGRIWCFLYDINGNIIGNNDRIKFRYKVNNKYFGKPWFNQSQWFITAHYYKNKEEFDLLIDLKDDMYISFVIGDFQYYNSSDGTYYKYAMGKKSLGICEDVQLKECKFDNIENITDSDYLDFSSPIEYMPLEDGTVEGIIPISSFIKLYTNTSSAIINVEYNKDINNLNLKNDIFNFKHKELYLYSKQNIQLGELDKLKVNIPDNIPDSYESMLSFISGDIPTEFISSKTISYFGDSVNDKGNFMPESNKLYSIKINLINQRIDFLKEVKNLFIAEVNSFDIKKENSTTNENNIKVYRDKILNDFKVYANEDNSKFVGDLNEQTMKYDIKVSIKSVNLLNELKYQARFTSGEIDSENIIFLKKNTPYLLSFDELKHCNQYRLIWRLFTKEKEPMDKKYFDDNFGGTASKFTKSCGLVYGWNYTYKQYQSDWRVDGSSDNSVTCMLNHNYDTDKFYIKFYEDCYIQFAFNNGDTKSFSELKNAQLKEILDPNINIQDPILSEEDKWSESYFKDEFIISLDDPLRIVKNGDINNYEYIDFKNSLIYRYTEGSNVATSYYINIPNINTYNSSYILSIDTTVNPSKIEYELLKIQEDSSFEKNNNKVTEISKINCNNINYPTEKAVVDYVDYYNDKNLKVFLPEDLYVAKGRIMEIYDRNVISSVNVNDYVFVWECLYINSNNKETDIGYYFNGKYCIDSNKTDLNIGNYELILKVCNHNLDVLKELTSTLHIVSSEINNNYTILPIGDSLTNGKFWLNEVYNISNNKISFTGTRWGTVGENNTHLHNEGRSGWTIGQYVNNTKYTFDSNGVGTENPFYNPSTQSFDLNYYQVQYNKEFNFIQIFLGTNGLGMATVNNESSWNTYGVNYQLNCMINNMIQNIRLTHPTIPIVICSPHYAGCKGLNTGSFISPERKHMAIFNMMEVFYNAFKDDPNIYFLPLGIWFDNENNYPTSEITLNPRSDITELYQTDTTHPNNNGYMQFADAMFSIFCAVIHNVEENSIV